jgi:hypothetical protein
MCPVFVDPTSLLYLKTGFKSLALKTQIKPNIVHVRDFNTPLSPIDRSFRQKINKETLELNGIVDQMDLQMSTEYSILQQHNQHFSWQPIELSLK